MSSIEYLTAVQHQTFVHPTGPLLLLKKDFNAFIITVSSSINKHQEQPQYINITTLTLPEGTELGLALGTSLGLALGEALGPALG